MKIIVTRNELKAALLFASTDESRYLLNGVLIECAPGKKPVLVTTDGKRLSVIETIAEQPDEIDEPHQILLHPEFALLFHNLSKACGGKISTWVQIENNPGSKRVVATIYGKDVFLDVHDGALIEGDYPAWRKALPPKSKLREPITDIGLNSDLIGDFAKAAKILECSPMVQMNLVGKEQCVEVRLTACEQFYGLVMQCRLDESIEYQPEFVQIVETFKKEEVAASKAIQKIKESLGPGESVTISTDGKQIAKIENKEAA